VGVLIPLETAESTTGVEEPEPDPLVEACGFCGDPLKVQHCSCIDILDDDKKVADHYSCMDDTDFISGALAACSIELGKVAVEDVDLKCEEPPVVLCPQPSEVALVCGSCQDEFIMEWHCKPVNNEEIWIKYSCAGDDGMQDFLHEKCASDLGMTITEANYTVFFTETVECPDFPDEPTGGEPLVDCEDWYMSWTTTYAGGVTYIDDGDVAALVDDSTPLFMCDDGRFQALSAGGFEVQSAKFGHIFYALGLRDGDIPLSLNGLPLESFSDVVDALIQLWYTEEETDYELEVQRPLAVVTLYISLY